MNKDYCRIACSHHNKKSRHLKPLSWKAWKLRWENSDEIPLFGCHLSIALLDTQWVSTKAFDRWQLWLQIIYHLISFNYHIYEFSVVPRLRQSHIFSHHGPLEMHWCATVGTLPNWAKKSNIRENIGREKSREIPMLSLRSALLKNHSQSLLENIDGILWLHWLATWILFMRIHVAHLHWQDGRPDFIANFCS